MLVLQALLTLGLVNAARAATASFINPAKAGADKDYSQDPAYTEGDTVIVEWSLTAEAGLPVTLALFQQDIGDDVDSSQEVFIGKTSSRSVHAWIRVQSNVWSM